MRGEISHAYVSFREGVGRGGGSRSSASRLWAPWRLAFRDVAQSGSAPEWGSGGRGFKSRRPDCSKNQPCNDFRCGAFSSPHPVLRVLLRLRLLRLAHDPMRRVEHDLAHRLGIDLLVGREQRLFIPPTARGGHVLHRIALSLRGPLSADRMPHPAGTRGYLSKPERPAQPVIEQVPTRRLGRILYRRKDGRVTNRLLCPARGRERITDCRAHRDGLLVALFVVLRAPT